MDSRSIKSIWFNFSGAAIRIASVHCIAAHETAHNGYVRIYFGNAHLEEHYDDPMHFEKRLVELNEILDSQVPVPKRVKVEEYDPAKEEKWIG